MGLLSKTNKASTISYNDLIQYEDLDVEIMGLASPYLCAEMPKALKDHTSLSASGERKGFALCRIFTLLGEEGFDWVLTEEGIEDFLLNKIRLRGLKYGKKWYIKTYFANKRVYNEKLGPKYKNESWEDRLVYCIMASGKNSGYFSSGLLITIPVSDDMIGQLWTTHEMAPRNKFVNHSGIAKIIKSKNI